MLFLLHHHISMYSSNIKYIKNIEHLLKTSPYKSLTSTSLASHLQFFFLEFQIDVTWGVELIALSPSVARAIAGEAARDGVVCDNATASISETSIKGGAV